MNIRDLIPTEEELEAILSDDSILRSKAFQRECELFDHIMKEEQEKDAQKAKVSGEHSEK